MGLSGRGFVGLADVYRQTVGGARSCRSFSWDGVGSVPCTVPPTKDIGCCALFCILGMYITCFRKSRTSISFFLNHYSKVRYMSTKRKSLSEPVLEEKVSKKGRAPDTLQRCPWVRAAESSEEMVRYHDEEWGTPTHCDRHLFEMLILEGAQAGLSWATILKKRDSYKAAFDNFDMKAIACYDDIKVQELLANGGIVRNRLKINAAIQNAKAALVVQEEFGSLDNYFWSFVDHTPIDSGGAYTSISDIPTQTAVSESLSKDLKRRGFKFVGPTIMYAFMQAVGMVNDHSATCFKRTTHKRTTH